MHTGGVKALRLRRMVVSPWVSHFTSLRFCGTRKRGRLWRLLTSTRCAEAIIKSAIAIAPGRLDAGGWMRSYGRLRWMAQGHKQLIVGLYRLRQGDEKIQLGPVAGSVSWEIIPATVKTRDGASFPLAEYSHYHDAEFNSATGMGTNFDLIRSNHSVLVHRTKGVLEELVADSEAEFVDATFDGKNVWVGDESGGIIVIDLSSGKLVARAGTGEGLPEVMRRLNLMSLGSGKAVVIAMDKHAAGAGAAYWPLDGKQAQSRSCQYHCRCRPHAPGLDPSAVRAHWNYVAASCTGRASNRFNHVQWGPINSSAAVEVGCGDDGSFRGQECTARRSRDETSTAPA